MLEKNMYDEEMAKLRKLMDDADLDMMFDGGYPIRLILKPRRDLYNQLSLLAGEEQEPAPETEMILVFNAGDISLEILGRMKIDDEVYKKIRSAFIKACWYYVAWLHYLEMAVRAEGGAA